jgi:hypothetical protein
MAPSDHPVTPVTPVPPLTPEEAGDRLDVADTLAATSGTAAARYATIPMAAVGLLAGTVLFACEGFAFSPWVSAIWVTVYVGALGASISWQYRRAPVLDHRWSLGLVAALGFTLVLCAIGIAWSAVRSPSLVVFAPYCVLVALPMALPALRTARR